MWALFSNVARFDAKRRHPGQQTKPKTFMFAVLTLPRGRETGLPFTKGTLPCGTLLDISYGFFSFVLDPTVPHANGDPRQTMARKGLRGGH